LSFRLEYYSKPEAGFGKDWCVVLDYLAAASFPTIFSTVSEFQQALPPRVLVDGDKAPFISDFTDREHCPGTIIGGSKKRLQLQKLLKCLGLLFYLMQMRFQKHIV